MKFSTSWHAAILLVSSFLFHHANAQIIQLTSDQLYEMATSGSIDLLLDVRSDTEWADGHIENATHVPGLQTTLENTDDYETTLTDLDLWNCRFCRVAVYCGSGARAQTALDYLLEAGFQGPLYNGQGVGQWTENGYELVNEESNEDRPCMNVDDDAVAVARNQPSVCVAEQPEDGAVMAEVVELEVDEFYQMLRAGEFNIVIDVRTEGEWETGHIPNATLFENLQMHLDNTDDYEATLTELNLWGCRYCRVALYCNSGRRAGQAIEHLAKAGFAGPIYNGKGVDDWTGKGYELVMDPSNDDLACITVEDPASVSLAQGRVCERQIVISFPDIIEDVALPGSEGSGIHDAAYYEAVQTELNTNRDLFLAQLAMHNSTFYSFMFTQTCFCPPQDYPWLVTAEIQESMIGVKPNLTEAFDPNMLMDPVHTEIDDVVHSAITSAGNDVMKMENPLMTYSVLDLFDKIQEAVDQQADEIRVVYDSYWGHPEEIYIDYSYMMADEEFMITVANMTMVEDFMEEDDFEMDTNSSQIGVDEGQIFSR